MTPETTAKIALRDALVAAFAADPDVEVSFGPPPDDSIKPRHVWIGGVDASEQTTSLRGGAGPGIDEAFTVAVVCDATVDDPSPAGAVTVDSDAYGLLRTVRDTVRQQLKTGPDIDLGPSTRSILRWSRVSAHGSDGPMPLVNRSGWAEAITTDVEFTTRIRGV